MPSSNNKCCCQSWAHGHQAGACQGRAITKDHLCKPCHNDKAAAEGMGWFMPLSQPQPRPWHYYDTVLAASGATPLVLFQAARTAELSLSSLIIPKSRTHEGILIQSTSAVWFELAQQLSTDLSIAFQLTPAQMEELVAGAFQKAGYDEVTVTHRSRDRGRDVIAIKRGVGCVKIIGSVKLYAPGKPVRYDAIRALLGVLGGERDASKGIITTTSDFPPRVRSDPIIAAALDTRLELMNGGALQRWLAELTRDPVAD
jgi:restriction system protein